MRVLVSNPVAVERPARRAPGPLEEADAALARGRHAEALRILERSLAATPGDDDFTARLRVARGLALWLSGRTRPGQAEVERAAERSQVPLTHARALEALGLIAWKSQLHDRAQAFLDDALSLYGAAGVHAGRARVLARQSALARDGGDPEASLALQREAVEAAVADGRDEVVAEALCDLGPALAALGRWDEAREPLVTSAALFAAVGDPREHTRAGLERAVVELAGGDVAAARASLDRARGAACPEGSDPRTLGEVALLRSDLLLAVGEGEGALEEASQGAALYASLGSSEGESRARMRMAHCLNGLGRPADALAQARRAFECAGPARPDVRAIALLAMGRAQLRTQPAAAERTFASAEPYCASRLIFRSAMRLGLAMARGLPREHPEVGAALAGLERWGDRRYLSQCLAAIDQLLGPEAQPVGPSEASVAPEDPSARALAAASVALGSAEPWPAGWTAALRAVAPVLPWTRAVLVGTPGWELRPDLDAARPLGADDLAWRLAARGGQPFAIDLAGDPALRRHPQRVLHSLRWSVVAPVRAGLSLQVDFRDGHGAGERELGLLVLLARLVESHGPGAEMEGASAMDAPFPGFGGIVGRCPAMGALLAEAARIPPLATTVHVYGETGTGKERLARALHLASGRSAGLLVPVNASSLDDELFESEMWGHVKGAFTGAVSDRRGFVAEAEGGTLFLDEVTDLSPRAQAKMLRFLQEREYRRLGDPRTLRANLRVVTASNAPLEEKVAAGQFRADLMYRLNQHVLALPPLRDRGDDIVLLARHCLQQHVAEHGLPRAPALSREAAAVLCRYAWPGNVRELESEMGRALVRSAGAVIRPEHLSLNLARRPSAAALPLRQAVSAFEREHISRALGRNGGNRSRTAVELGLSRQALLAKITRLGIAPAAPR